MRVSEIIVFTNVLFWISSLPSNLFSQSGHVYCKCFKSLVTKNSSFCWTATCSFIVRSPVARFSSRQPSSVLLLRIPPLGMRFPLCCSVWSCLGFNVIKLLTALSCLWLSDETLTGMFFLTTKFAAPIFLQL